VNIPDMMTDPDLFGFHFAPNSYNTWRAVLKGAFAAPMSEAEWQLYRKATHRETQPAHLRELWMVIGRRGGKD
jgi:hypothetical protein